MNPFYIAISILILTVTSKILYDRWRWEKGLKVNHSVEIFIAAVPISYAAWELSKTISWHVVFIGNDIHFLIEYLCALFFLSGWFLFLFNGGYNLARKYDWFFIGTKDANDSWTERFFRFIGPIFTVFIQIILVILPSVLYFIKRQ